MNISELIKGKKRMADKDFLTFNEFKKRTATGVTVYQKPTLKDRAKQAIGAVKQKSAEYKLNAPERKARAKVVKGKIKSFSNRIKGNLARNAGGSSNNPMLGRSSNNVFVRGSAPGNNIFTQGSGNNPYNFNNDQPRKENRVKSITIKRFR